VINHVHVFMGKTDDINVLLINEIKYNMLPLRKAVVTLCHISTMLTKLGVHGLPFKAFFEIFQVCVALSLTPMLLSIATDIF